MSPRPVFFDSCGRGTRYLRLSVTDRCDLRCRYCMPRRPDFLPKKDLLSLEELSRLGRVFVSHGVEKIRITGGEPLVRRNVMALFKSLGQLLPVHASSGLETLSLTTNGMQLEKYADELYAYGVRRVNFSLDSLDEDTFAQITRGGRLSVALEGLAAAQRAGLKVKINCVALRGVNTSQPLLDHLIGWCGERACDLTFIEIMPMGDIGNETRLDQFYPLTRLRARIASHWTLEDSDYDSGGPARYAECRETEQRIGFISPLTKNFCATCTRVRVTCTGILYPCLGHETRTDLRPVMRTYPDDDAPLSRAIAAVIKKKLPSHKFAITSRSSPPAVARTMNVTGG